MIPHVCCHIVGVTQHKTAARHFKVGARHTEWWGDFVDSGLAEESSTCSSAESASGGRLVLLMLSLGGLGCG